MQAHVIERLAAPLASAESDTLLPFVHAYRDLSFGYTAACRYAELGTALPVALEGADTWVFRAWLHRVDPERFPEPVVRGALALRTAPMEAQRVTLHALLVSPGATVTTVAHQLGLDSRVVEAYEQLFFNVLDRRREASWIASVVYPRTRLVELFDNYLRSEPLGDLMLRMGYNNGARDVLYFAGMDARLLADLANQDTPQRLESVIMAHGYLLARQGWQNLRADMAGFTGARSLIAAAKAGGETTGEGDDLQAIGPAIMAQIQSRSAALSFDDAQA